jgi:hypothetical protein
MGDGGFDRDTSVLMEPFVPSTAMLSSMTCEPSGRVNDTRRLPPRVIEERRLSGLA